MAAICIAVNTGGLAYLGSIIVRVVCACVDVQDIEFYESSWRLTKASPINLYDRRELLANPRTHRQTRSKTQSESS